MSDVEITREEYHHLYNKMESQRDRIHTLTQQVERAREGLKAIKAKVLTPTDAETVLAWIESMAEFTLNAMEGEER